MAHTSFPPVIANAGRVPTILAVTWVQCSVALMVVSARMFTRGYRVRNIGIDDWTMLLAMVNCFVIWMHFF